MPLRIVVTGAECTGKTTLTRALSGYFGEPWSAEFVRGYVADLDRPLCEDDLEPIARGQLQLEDSSADKAKRLVLHDTNLLSSILYANAYFHKTLDWVNEAFLGRDYALYLLCLDEGIPWEKDGPQRDSPAARERLQETFKTSLEDMGLPFITLGGAPELRFGLAVKAVEERLASAEG
jgi:nicotinamide riboside kinase